MNKRLNYIDISRFIAIMMIVDVHLTSGSVFKIIGGNTFHVILFFTASGIVYGLDEKKPNNFKQYLIHKVRTIIYPYIIFSILNIGLQGALALITHKFDRITESFIRMISMQGVGTLWFFPVFFVSQLLFFPFKKMIDKRKNKLLFCLLGFLIAVFINSVTEYYGLVGAGAHGIGRITQIIINGPAIILFGAIIGASWISIGYSASFEIKKISDKNLKNGLLLAAIGTVSLIVNINLSPLYNGDLHYAQIGNPISFVVCTIAGNIFAITVSMLLNYVPKVNNLLSWYGRNSIIIMTTHKEFYLTHIVYLLLSSAFLSFGLSIGHKMLGLFSLLVIFAIEALIIVIIRNTALKYLYIPYKKRKNEN